MKSILKSSKLAKVCYDIRGPVLDQAKLMEEEGQHIIKLNIGNPGSFGFDAPEEIIPAALAYIGEDPRTNDTDVIAKAEAVISNVRPYIQKFHSSQYIDALSNGDICLVVGWSGDIFMAQYAAWEAENGVEIVYTIPDEGALMWFDQLAIPKDAPNVENALKYINWIMDPQQIANATNYVWYANGNLASQPLLDPELLSDPAVYPTPEVMEGLYISPQYDNKAQRVVTRTWTKVKTGQ